MFVCSRAACCASLKKLPSGIRSSQRERRPRKKDMLAAVILSGGASSRMGFPKALLAYQGRPFLEHLLEVTEHPKIGVRRIVLGAHAEPIAKSIALSADEIVINADWNSGQLSSIQAAILSLPAAASLPTTKGLPSGDRFDETDGLL